MGRKGRTSLVLARDEKSRNKGKLSKEADALLLAPDPGFVQERQLDRTADKHIHQKNR